MTAYQQGMAMKFLGALDNAGRAMKTNHYETCDSCLEIGTLESVD